MSVMVDYVDILTEKYNSVHHQLTDVRRIIDENNIVIERAVVQEKESVGKSRSVSLVCPPSSGLVVVDRRASTGQQVM